MDSSGFFPPVSNSFFDVDAGSAVRRVSLRKLLKEKNLQRGERSFLCVLVSSGCCDKVPQTAGLKPREFISRSSGVQDQGPQMLRVARTHFLAPGRPPSCCVLAWWREGVLVLVPPYEARIRSQGPTLTTSSKLTSPHFLKPPHWLLGLQRVDVGGEVGGSVLGLGTFSDCRQVQKKNSASSTW